LYQIYTQDERSLEEEDIISTSHQYRQKWLKLKQEYPEEYKIAIQLPEMMNLAIPLNNKKYKNTLSVFCKAGDFFKLKLVNLKGEVIENDDWKIIPLFECSIDTKEIETNKDYLKLMDKILLDFEREANIREQKRFTPEKIVEQVIRRLDFLKRGKSNNFKNKVEDVKSKLIKAQLKHSDIKKIRSVLKKYGNTPEDFVNEINSIINNLTFIEIEDKPKYVYAQLILAEFYN